ncbi:FtsW/RodA/SpoVE family cell cycle protein [Funiculus sociatus GB2-A5]|uniref:Probable peptidoglycan glycosyltransferase FtsW n=1 Tax=Funiculus sociatus GB2-A5 TaxID=2933946 RepID=A0ABV0JYY6_9CYAN|nr:FtsW/RodA/SpoVE family cell cycle protein [Trichocoleus sp. FACHB-832]MBD2062395.1 FtsW/RodA/SpoVE family cell cycle protein [Trichocoleus sp. FACHB-6]
MNLRQLVPFFNPAVQDWAIDARLLRWLTFLWLFIGLVVLFSASYPSGDAEYGDGLYYFKRQIISVMLGLLVFNVVVNFPLRHVLGIANWCVILLLGVIFVTLIPGVGTTTNGATRWIALGPFPLQPSELIKPFLVLQSARIFGNWDRLTWRVRLTWLFIFCCVLLGIILQPNLSTTALCGMTLWLIALAAGLPFSYLGGTALGGLLLATISISVKEYQRRRVMSFLNPWADPMQDGYQLVQSLLAVGSGGTWGSGFGLSQQKLFYLPIQYTDFIFAVYAEEFGFAGSLLLIVLLMAYATLALMVAMRAKTPIHRLVAIGTMVLMVGQSLLNIGVATGVLPTTGLPLPLFSYGGNSMIASLMAAGLLIRVARESSEAEVVPLQGRRFVQGRSRRVIQKPNA